MGWSYEMTKSADGDIRKKIVWMEPEASAPSAPDEHGEAELAAKPKKRKKAASDEIA